MGRKQTFFLTLSVFFLIFAFGAIDNIWLNRSERTVFGATLAKLSAVDLQFLAENPAVKAQLVEIDEQISELEAMKRGFEARALRHEDQAQRLQFEDRASLETKKHFELADENRARAEKVKKEIDRLQEQKRKLLNR